LLPIVRRRQDALEVRDLPAHLLKDYDRAKLMELERQYLSFSPGDHPMGAFAGALAGQDIVRSIDIGGFIGRLVTVAGVIVAMRRAVTRQRELMQFVTLEDRWGLVEVILFPNAYKQLAGTFGSFGPYLVQGVVQENLGSLVLIGRSVQLLTDPQRETPPRLDRQEQTPPHLCG
jgi:DNA polymerase-3 subunit alpha